MIQVEKFSYGFPSKDLYNEISFTLETGCHCALIGSNGTGKSTLADILIHPEKYLYDGVITRDEDCRTGYASQFSARDKERDCTVFGYLSERFLKIQHEITAVCEELASAEDPETLYEKYQQLLDLNGSMDGDNYESNIRRQLNTAGMGELAEVSLSQISGGEYKLLQIMREMLLSPNLLVLDEPDVFLDFGNLGSLCQLINSYDGTLLVITHNRYLLDHCFNKILHLENGDIQEFNGTYTEYRCAVSREKAELKRQSIEEQEEIERTQEMVDILRKRATEKVNPVIGRAVNAKQTQLDRLIARQIKAPFIEIREPEITLPQVETEDDKTVLSVTGYNVGFDDDLLGNVDFQLKAGEKAAVVGANGTGKTTLIRDILKNDDPAIHIDEDTRYACMSQLQGEMLDEDKTVYQIMQDAGFDTRTEIREYLSGYCLEEKVLDQKAGELSGGEQNLLQIAVIAASDAQLLILDEPTSHLDLYAQAALEKAVSEYSGTILMVSHDFYLVANCADYILLAEDNTLRRVRARKFRKMVYDRYFDPKYLEIDRRKQELEADITAAFMKDDLDRVEKLCDQLEELDRKQNR